MMPFDGSVQHKSIQPKPAQPGPSTTGPTVAHPAAAEPTAATVAGPATTKPATVDTARIKELLHQQNFRLTQEREVLLSLFADSEAMLTPSQLYDLARANQVKIGLTTVYRLLEALTKVNVVTPFVLDGSIYYAFCGCNHHHHFVCLSCHHVIDIHGACPTIEVPDSCEVAAHRCDVFGTCPSCNDTHADEAGERSC